MPATALRTALAAFATNLTANFATQVAAQPEDQLKAPVQALLAAAGEAMSLAVVGRTETHVANVDGRPDIGVAVDGLLAGHVELKAPGLGADVRRLKGRNREQWERFSALPNLIYTDGTEWALYRSGRLEGALVRLSGDVTRDGAGAATAEDAEKLWNLLFTFLHWEPIVPDTPKELAALLAPLCRFLRGEVLEALEREGSGLRLVESQWHDVLFSNADRAQFADAYAQTVTYALLLAKFSGLEDVTPGAAADALNHDHSLLAQALRILADPQLRGEIGASLDILTRAISAIDRHRKGFARQDPWLYFYEDFLAEYDRKLRNDRGVYYTPMEVVGAMTRLVADVLRTRFRKPLAFADREVVLLDPAAGTGAFPLAAFQMGIDAVRERMGDSATAGTASSMAENIHAFELLVGPYAVAHLRLTQSILSIGGAQLPADGVHVYLTDTLESPDAAPKQMTTLHELPLSREHARAQRVKKFTRVLVCMGNPPYDRQQIAQDTLGEERRGGWVRFGDPQSAGADKQRTLLDDFLDPLRAAGLGGHAKNLYNDYVYFWRWALWKVFESSTPQGPGVVCFITASSYLRGPAFGGMREMMRRTFDELWIIDLEGDNLGPRKTENVFAIQTPVAIALGVRKGAPHPKRLAEARYVRLTGTRREKLDALDAIQTLADLPWQACSATPDAPLLPMGVGEYQTWPLLTDLFPWQHTGAQFKRTWPIGESPEVLKARWERFVAAPPGDRPGLFRETRDRCVVGKYRRLLNGDEPDRPLAETSPALPRVARYGFRSLDRQWVLADSRLGDYLRPSLWHAYSESRSISPACSPRCLGTGRRPR